MAKKRINVNLAWFPRAMPIVGVIIGGLTAGWLGALAGLSLDVLPGQCYG